MTGPGDAAIVDGWLRVCAAEALVDGGDGVRFELPVPHAPAGEGEAAFAVRWQGVAHAYLNRCAHVPLELDWLPGRFFDDGQVYLVCATHGALYVPDTGECVGGPCRGRSLRKLPVVERDGAVWVLLSPQIESAPARSPR